MTGLSSGPALCSKAFKAHHNGNLEHAATPGGVGAADKEDRELRRRHIARCGIHKYVNQLLLLLGSEGGDTLPKYADYHLHAGMILCKGTGWQSKQPWLPMGHSCGLHTQDWCGQAQLCCAGLCKQECNLRRLQT